MNTDRDVWISISFERATWTATVCAHKMMVMSPTTSDDNVGFCSGANPLLVTSKQDAVFACWVKARDVMLFLISLYLKSYTRKLVCMNRHGHTSWLILSRAHGWRCWGSRKSIRSNSTRNFFRVLFTVVKILAESEIFLNKCTQSTWTKERYEPLTVVWVKASERLFFGSVYQRRSGLWFEGCAFYSVPKRRVPERLQPKVWVFGAIAFE